MAQPIRRTSVARLRPAAALAWLGGTAPAAADGAFDGGETLTLEFWDDVAGEQVTATEISCVAVDVPGISDGDAIPAEISIAALGSVRRARVAPKP